MIVYLLRNESYYNISKDEIGSVTGDIILYSELTSLFLGDLLSGLLHDIFRTRVNILIGLLLSAAATAAMPFGSSPIPYLIFLRIIFLFGFAPVMTNPLLIDYVEHESRGIAQSWTHISTNLGFLVMNYGVFEIAK